MNRSLSILLVLSLFSPLWLVSDNLSPGGFLITFFFFFLLQLFQLGSSKPFLSFIIRLYRFTAYIFLFISCIIAFPIILSLISSANTNPENYVYAFKQVSFLSVDINYISIVFLASFLYKPSYSGFAFLFLSSSRASVVISLVVLAAKSFTPRLLRARFIFILSVCILLFSLIGLNDFIEGLDLNSNDAQTIVSSRSLAYKLLTYQSLTDLITSGSIGSLLLGSGVSFDQNTLTITGHTLFGVIAKNGILYVLCSVMVLYLSCSMRSLDTRSIFCAAVLVSLFSMTAFFFLTPLCFSYSSISCAKSSNLRALPLSSV